jgi:hypothetical protein
MEPLEGRVVPATISVLNTNNDGAGSLRAAIDQANMDPAQDTIDFAPAVTGTITLSSALPDLSTSIILSGPGASALIVTRSSAPGTPGFRIFSVPTGAEVTISGLTITGGLADNGGGVSKSMLHIPLRCRLARATKRGRRGGARAAGGRYERVEA